MRTSQWIWGLTAVVGFTSASAGGATAADAHLRVLVVSGENNHDCHWTSPQLAWMLEVTGRFDVDITYEPAKTLGDANALTKYQAVVLDYNGARWGEPAETNFLTAVKNGLGVAVIHAANNSFSDWPEYQKLVGDCWIKGTTGHGQFHEFDVKVTDATHPITNGLGDIKAHPDELYHQLVRTPGTNYRVLATAFSTKESGGTGKDEPMILVGEYGKGRVFHTPLGHVWPGALDTHVSQLDLQFQRLVARGVEWAATGSVQPETWRVLFDGKDASQWRGFKQATLPAKGWSVRDGALVVEKAGGGGDLVSKDEFGDFALSFEFRVTAKANSGVMYRVAEDQDQTYYTGPEYQVLADDYFEAGKFDPMHSAGALYDLMPASGAKLVPNGQFNRGLIVVRGWKIDHWVNDRLVAQCDLASEDGQKRIAASKFATMPGFAKHARGLLALQDHGDEVAYRNIRVRELAPSSGGSVALFNGKNLDGWTFFLNDNGKRDDVWSVTDGVLNCKGTPLGYLRTEADYTNYVLDVDWRWGAQPGNSGVLLRMTGPDKVWPKSLEAQLQADNAGDFWKIDEFPCTTDASRTNGRNCKKTHANEKPIGEWNHYHITVDHGTVTLEVNGQVLNQATGAAETPGKICLQSEGAEIHFRDIRLTQLP